MLANALWSNLALSKEALTIVLTEISRITIQDRDSDCQRLVYKLECFLYDRVLDLSHLSSQAVR